MTPNPLFPARTDLSKVKMRVLYYRYNGEDRGIDRVVYARPVLPSTWLELHTYRPKGILKADLRFLGWFIARIQGASSGKPCDCRKEFELHVVAYPVRWHDYFAWTVEVHNKVNARLGKPVLTVAEARQIWALRE